MEDQATSKFSNDGGDLSHLTCTAKDVSIANADQIQITEIDGDPTHPLVGSNLCVDGLNVTFSARFEVVSTAKERFDIGLYFNNDGGADAREGAHNDSCNVYNITPDGLNLDLDDQPEDLCDDVTKVDSPFFHFVEIETLCQDSDGDGQLNLPNCVSWRQQGANELCSGPEDAYPGAPSKCNCADDFNVPVFIAPEPPEIVKAFNDDPSPSPRNQPEPGGVFNQKVSFLNDNGNSIFLTSLSDKVDINGNGSYDVSLNLWGGNPPLDLDTQGVYLTSSTCVQPANTGNGIGEIVAGDTYSCEFTVHIVDWVVPTALIPEDYDDVVLVTLNDENSDPLSNGSNNCPTGVGLLDGQFCSDPLTVQITNLPPDISVTKTANPTSVIEPGGDVVFTVDVTYNDTSVTGFWDDPITLDTLTDTDFGNLALLGNCATGGTIALGTTYTCSFTKTILGGFGDTAHMNTVTATASDDEGDSDTATGSATVSFTDLPSVIKLIKTAGGEADGDVHNVLETGDSGLFRDVVYKFEFSVDGSSVDNVIFDTLEDVVDPDGAAIFTDLTSQCIVKSENGSAVLLADQKVLSLGWELEPGEFASCEITLSLQGDAGETRSNMATIRGIDSDGAAKNATDPADVLFINQALQITPQVAMKVRVFVRLPNGGVDDVEISTLLIGGINLVNGAGGGILNGRGFKIIDETAGTFGPYIAAPELPVTEGNYVFCSTGTIIDAGTTHECGFTIKLIPGFVTGFPLSNDDNAPADIFAEFQGLAGGLIIGLDDGDVTPVNTVIDFNFITVEP